MKRTEATAYHEAGHVIALRSIGRRAMEVCVVAQDEGYTSPDALPKDSEQMALVGLAGVQAEAQHSDSNLDIEGIIGAYVGASSDRNVIAKAFNDVWLGQPALWYQTKYNKAHKFVQDHGEEIRAVAEAILSIEGFPKSLDETAIDAVLEN
jgi:hypothetical protein